MATWYPISERIGAIAILNADTTQMHPFGTRTRAYDATLGECEFVYVKGVATTIAGMVATYLPYTGVTALATTRARGLVGVFMAALNAATLFGWLQVKGVAEVSVTAAVVAGTTPYTTATAGKVLGTVVAGDIIYGATFATADGTPAANFARMAINEPYCGDTDNA